MSALADDLPEVFERFGRVVLRRMFGGHGVFHEGLMLGLVIGGRLYLKVDAETRPVFEARGLPAFEYRRAGRAVKLSYHEAPPEFFEEREEAARWACLARDAAVRGVRPSPRPRPPGRKPAAPAKARSGRG